MVNTAKSTATSPFRSGLKRTLFELCATSTEAQTLRNGEFHWKGVHWLPQKHGEDVTTCVITYYRIHFFKKAFGKTMFKWHLKILLPLVSWFTPSFQQFLASKNPKEPAVGRVGSGHAGTSLAQLNHGPSSRCAAGGVKLDIEHWPSLSPKQVIIWSYCMRFTIVWLTLFFLTPFKPMSQLVVARRCKRVLPIRRSYLIWRPGRNGRWLPVEKSCGFHQVNQEFHKLQAGW